MEKSSPIPARVKRLDASNPALLADCRCLGKRMNSRGGFVVSVIAISFVLLTIYALLREPRWDLDFEQQEDLQQPDDFVHKDYPLDDHLPTGFDNTSCRSRFESGWYRRGLSKKASPHLISRLRRHEALHKKCGPHTDSYKKLVEDLKFGRHPTASDCKYVVWLPQGGLGNRILTITSAFLYALLTNRVLLVDRGFDIPDLFCEPFPETSWLLPSDFPLAQRFKYFDQGSEERYGHKLRSNSFSNSTDPYVFAYLAGNYDESDRLFYCNQDQMHLQNTPWMIMKTDLYLAPYLFLTPYFKEELSNLFPDKESVFHLLGRYLFHPTNSAWDFITRYYRAYLAKADVKVGIQVRIFDTRQSRFEQVLDEILSCTTKGNILPRIGHVEQSINGTSRKQKTIAVLMTSLSSGYSREIRKMYFKHLTVTGELISVHQPSHEEYQRKNTDGHNKKAWTEMYLLSLTDKLITSSQSTFGYVAQGLGGLQPWILDRVVSRTVPDPPCQRGISIEPCCQSLHYYDCKMRREVDSGGIVPYIKRCEDVSWGFKIVPSSNTS